MIENCRRGGKAKEEGMRAKSISMERKKKVAGVAKEEGMRAKSKRMEREMLKSMRKMKTSCERSKLVAAVLGDIDEVLELVCTCPAEQDGVQQCGGTTKGF
jgi:hypothetical protein